MFRLTLLLALLLAHAMVAQSALAQNCANVKSGLNANQKPQNTGRDIVGQSLDDIEKQGWITFAVYEDFAPYSYEQDGKLKGIDIDLGNLIAEKLGVEARFYATQAAENVDGDLRINVWKGRLIGGQIANVMLHIPYNRELACRNEQVVLNGQYFNERIGIAFRKSEYPDGGPLPAYFRYDSVGVENDTISDFYLSGLAGGQIIPKMQRFKSYDAAMAALRDGKVMAVMGPMAQLEHGIAQDSTEDLTVHTPPLPGLASSQWTLGVAVRHTWRPLSYAVDDAIRAALVDGALEAIFKSHELSFTPPKW